MPKISVIIPVYNIEKYLARCLDSVISQTLKDIEIICVNDGSTDNSANILSVYAEKDERIKIITQSNAGISEARNIGIQKASGEFIGFVDSDDFIEKDFYEKLYTSAIKNNADIACSSVIRENEKKKKILIEYKKEQVATSTKEKFELAHIPEHCYIWNKIYNREKLLNSNIKFIKGLVYEDIIYTPSVVESLGNIVVVPNVFYHYWNNSTSLVKNTSDKCRADKIFAHKILLEKCYKNNVKLRLKDELICKNEYFLFGIKALKILKIYQYRATKVYSLFGLLPILICEEHV